MGDTAIEWTERSWNPIVGCSLATPGCTHCYAMAMAARIERMGTAPHYAGLTQPTRAGAVWTGKLALAPEHAMLEPLRRRKPTTWFVNSMGDLFHEDVPDAWIDRVFAVMALTPQHTYQVLTKRAARMRAYIVRLSAFAERDRRNDLPAIWQERLSEAHEPGRLPITKASVKASFGFYPKMPGDLPTPAWPLSNVWFGVSAEDQKRADERIPDLLATPAAVRFVSAEPLLGLIRFDELRPDGIKFTLNALTGEGHHLLGFAGQTAQLDWIIVGGESGPKARPMHPTWARSIRDQCAAAGTAFFFKQWGEWGPTALAQVKPSSRLVAAMAGEVDGARYMDRVGKARSGRLLDGVEHNAMPEVAR
ncbi:phage Gp37/Gp68 family protein [Bosea sp. (in: a-proteobacteria)]|uniref:phage Gp37/Gp68 family protein n=1 Tax=Bosea sp. (in: a-proteobacteria) TaxID=1871050 RepID=UPI003B3A627C